MIKQPEFETLVAILEAKKTGNKKLVHEASLSRIYSHFLSVKNRDENASFSIITSWRGNLPKIENELRMEELKSSIRSLGYGFIPLKGHWKECQDDTIPYDQCPPDKLKDSIEPSLFIVGISKEEAMGLCVKYNQDAIVFSGPETNGAVTLQFKNGEEIEIGDFTPGAVSQAYSTWKNRNFHFESIEYVFSTEKELFLKKLFS